MGGALKKLLPKKDNNAKKAKNRQGQLELMRRTRCRLRYHDPAEAMGAAGGTASMFRLEPPRYERTLRDDPDTEDAQYDWIGKDLGHAFDELEFYMAAEEFRDEDGRPYVGWQILNHLVPFAGSLEQYPTMIGDTQKAVDLIAIDSMTRGLNSPRLLDLKIGSKTSAADWKGKTAVASMRQGILDGLTNSVLEGLRLEGFSKPPAWCDSEDPLADAPLIGKNPPKKLWKKLKRIQLQSKRVAEVLEAFIDLRSPSEEGHDEGSGPAIVESSKFSTAEYAELVLLRTIEQLADIFRSCQAIEVPQKWIGSSVAIVTDADHKPDRPSAKNFNGEWPEVPVRVKLFDWGRSEFNTRQLHEALPDGHQQDRQEFWGLYMIGIGKILWYSSRLYWGRFCILDWISIKIEVHSYNSVTGSTLLGSAEMELPKNKKGKIIKSLTLKDEHGDRVMGRHEMKSQVALGAEFIEYPEPSRLGGAWVVTIHRAQNLPYSDNFCLSRQPSPWAQCIMQESPDSAAACGIPAPGRQAAMRTSVKTKSADPIWGDRFEFPVVASAEVIEGSTYCDFAGLSALSEAMTEEGERKQQEVGERNDLELEPGDSWVIESFLVDGMPAGERQFLDVFLRKTVDDDAD